MGVNSHRTEADGHGRSNTTSWTSLHPGVHLYTWSGAMESILAPSQVRRISTSHVKALDGEMPLELKSPKMWDAASGPPSAGDAGAVDSQLRGLSPDPGGTEQYLLLAKNRLGLSCSIRGRVRPSSQREEGAGSLTGPGAELHHSLGWHCTSDPCPIGRHTTHPAAAPLLQSICSSPPLLTQLKAVLPQLTTARRLQRANASQQSAT